MILGFDAKRLFNNSSGLGNYSRTLVNNLSLLHPVNDYFLYSPLAKNNELSSSFFNNSNIQIRESNGHQPLYWRSFSIINQLKKDGIQLYHGLSNELPFSIPKAGIASVVSIHDLIFKVYPKTYKILDRMIYDKKVKFSCTAATKVIAISESTKRDLIEVYNIPEQKIEVVYQSINPVYFDSELIDMECLKTKFNLPTEYLLYVGTVERRKNLELIIEALSILPSNMKIPLVIIGKSKKYKLEILKKIASKKLEKYVYWVSGVDTVLELKTIYTHAQILIYPSLYEGFGLPIVEALACKTPVITSNVSSMPEAGGGSTIYINPNDPGQLADSIINILGNFSLNTSMREKGLDYAQNKFNGIATTQRLLEVYKELL